MSAGRSPALSNCTIILLQRASTLAKCQKYSNRDQWSGIPVYRKLISGPMRSLERPGVGAGADSLCGVQEFARWCDDSQGIQLFSNAGIRRFYRGIVRNAEQTDEDALPKRIPAWTTLTPKMRSGFEASREATCFLLHLSEVLMSVPGSIFLRCRSRKTNGRSGSNWLESTVPDC
jgi:hypothetical protein